MKKILLILICCLISLPVIIETTGGEVYATTQTSKKNKKSKQKKKNTKKKKKKKVNTPPQTSADAKRQQADAEAEIKRTQQEIEENNLRLSRQLSQLQLLDADISESELLIANISHQIAILDGRIDTLSSQISANEKKLTELRNKYLQTIKQFRLTRGKTNALAFIFSSKSFSQAIRRIRYLRQFAEWRSQKVAQITAIQTTLITQKQLLAQTKNEKNAILSTQIKAKENLITQQSEQQKLVAELRQNGQSLKNHLTAKQAEADNLKSQISILIAEEERKAEEERRIREEQQRQAEEEARRIEQERREAEQRSTAQQTQQTSTETPQQKKKKKTQTTATQQTDNRTYADARGRQRRGRQDTQTTGQMQTQTATSNAGNFEKAKGSLPRPAGGKFQIVSHFGRHAHPDIPDVEYDNPGIDAEVSPGASAQAVFAGKVSGVYVLKGFRTVIIVNHGNYYTVYGNIASPSVKVGDMVSQGQALGKLYSDSEDNNRTTIHFEVWRNREKLNPTEWIK